MCAAGSIVRDGRTGRNLLLFAQETRAGAREAARVANGSKVHGEQDSLTLLPNSSDAA